jgi:hypothetical protein
MICADCGAGFYSASLSVQAKEPCQECGGIVITATAFTAMTEEAIRRILGD